MLQGNVCASNEETWNARLAIGKTDLVDLDQLPIPDYNEYHRLAEMYSILWKVPVEGSRGCWWDRRTKTGNGSHACFFCGLNGSSPRREKSAIRIAAEMNALAERHGNVRFQFTDNLVSQRDAVRLADKLSSGDRSYRFSVDVRANISTVELLELRRAGCHAVQIGVEGLATGYLKRLNKGTTAIQNLRAMKACFELGIRSMSNLLVGFPGATPVDVAETLECVSKYAIAYEPLEVSHYVLVADSPVFWIPEDFGVSNIRNASAFARVLPGGSGSQIKLPWLEYDVTGNFVDWSTVEEACRHWRELHEKLRLDRTFPDIPMPLFYFEGGSFLEIVDRRDGYQTVVLEPLWREIYLYCMEVRSETKIMERFCGRVSKEKLVNEILNGLVSEGLMFQEGSQYLSLAVAWRPDVAIRRIRAQQQEEEASKNAGSPREGSEGEDLVQVGPK